MRNSIDLAQLGERLGYTRYWVAEHHGSQALACASPEVLIGPIAAATSRIHVGSGGVMLPHYSPLKVAENFSMLASLYPDRIDLGLGRAAGTSPNIALALQRDRRQLSPDDFREALDELLALLGNRWPASGEFPQLSRLRFTAPETWLLGSSQDSVVWAAELGLPYVFADFINPHRAVLTRHYRQCFEASANLAKPYVGVAVWAICADTDEEADRLSWPFRMMMTLLFRGRSIRVPDIETAQRFLADLGGAPGSHPEGRRIVTGNPERVRNALQAIADDYEADELFVVNIMPNHAARRRSYELLAQAFGLNG